MHPTLQLLVLQEQQKQRLLLDTLRLLQIQQLHQPRPVSLPIIRMPPAMVPVMTPSYQRLVSPPVPSAQAPSPKPERDETDLLTMLGSPERDSSLAFVDVLTLPNMVRFRHAPAVAKGGVAEAFPYKLHRMLEELDVSIIAWLPHGRAFTVINRLKLEQVLSRFCKQHYWSSFRRQLNLYGFNRKHGVYYHELFVRHYPGLCKYMQRVGVHGREIVNCPDLDRLIAVQR